MKRKGELRLVASRYKSRVAHFKAYQPKRQIYNLVWIFHEHDDDFIPPVPHGHSGKYKLDVLNGNVYRGNERKPIGHARKKELYSLQHDRDFQEYARKHIRWYKENHPKIPVEMPIWLREPVSGRKVLVSRKNNDEATLIFILKTIITEK